MTQPAADLAWIHRTLGAARPKAVAALLRQFRDLDRAEEAFQEAALRALAKWPVNGPPRDPAAWLIFVGRNAGIDGIRRTSREDALPDDDALLSDTGDIETATVEAIDHAAYRDDILRLLFICCHPELPATSAIPLALRIVSGLTVAEIAAAFLVSDAAMEQRITRAKAKVAAAETPFEAPDAAERDRRLGTVLPMLYLVFNQGYSVGVAEAGAKAPLAREAIRLARLLLSLFPAEAEVMGLLALMLLTHARAGARFDGDGRAVLLEDQDRAAWDRRLIGEGLALVDKALRHRAPGPYQVQAAIAALHARATYAADTDWPQIERLYATLERMQPSPVVTLNRAVAVAQIDGPHAALDLIEPLGERLDGYFPWHGARGVFLERLGRDAEAGKAFTRALSLARTAAEAADISGHLERLRK